MNVNKMFAELRKVDRNLVPCPFSTSVSIHCMAKKSYSFLAFIRVRFTSWICFLETFSKSPNAERWTLQSMHCRKQIMQCYWMPHQVFREQFEQILQKDLRSWHFEVNMLTRGTPWSRHEYTNATAFTAFHEFARANTSEFHFHGSSWFWFVNLRAERVSLQCMCYTQSPKYEKSLPVQRRQSG